MPDKEPRNSETASDIESLRDPSELPHHWQLRKSFLLTHKGKFSSDRLICLSHVFVNVECMGTKYPEEVMRAVKELGSCVDKSTLIEPVQHEQLEYDEQQPQQQRNRNQHQRQHYNQRNFNPRPQAPYQERHSSPAWQGNYGSPQQRYSVPRQHHALQSGHYAPSQPRHLGPPQQNRYDSSRLYQTRPRYGRPFQQQEQRHRRDY